MLSTGISFVNSEIPLGSIHVLGFQNINKKMNTVILQGCLKGTLHFFENRLILQELSS